MSEIGIKFITVDNSTPYRLYAFEKKSRKDKFSKCKYWRIFLLLLISHSILIGIEPEVKICRLKLIFHIIFQCIPGPPTYWNKADLHSRVHAIIQKSV